MSATHSKVFPRGKTWTSPARLTAKHQRFVAEFLIDGNATQACIRSGYSRKTARVQGSRLLTNAAIAAAVKAGQRATAEKLDTTRDQIAAELRSIGFAPLPKTVSAADKRQALVDLAKLLGFWQEKHQLDAGGSLAVLIAAAVTFPTGETR